MNGSPTTTIDLAPPTIIEPQAESNETFPQDHSPSSNAIWPSWPRRPSLRRRKSISALLDSTILTLQDPATDGTPRRVEVAHHWVSIAKNATQDIIKNAIGHAEPPPKLPVYEIALDPDEGLFNARIELPHSRRKSSIKIRGVDTGGKVECAAVMPKSLADRLSSSARQCLAPNMRHKTIFVDGNELELCELVRATCSFPQCPDFFPGRTYRWYWVVVNDERNVLGEKAFIPYDIVLREKEKMPHLPTPTGLVSLLDH